MTSAHRSPSSHSTARSFRIVLPRSLFAVSAIGLAIAGCNSILDNKPAKLDPAAVTKADSTLPSTPPPTPSQTSEPEPSSPCATENHLCNGTCVPATDPTYGCGAATCKPCSPAHASAVCQANGCAIAACDKGYADCNNDPTDGCEVDFSKATSCGSCNAACPAATPICSPAGDTFQCVTGCTPATPLLCGTECVAPQTSVNHCGACNTKCADVPNATVSCEGGTCKFTCKPSWHACNGGCVVDTDPLACGPECTVCTVPANATATCQGNACAFQCTAGFADCNVLPNDGCEAVLASDPLNCGACDRSCNGGTCNAGICIPPNADP